MHFFKSAALKSTSIRLSSTQVFARLPQLRKLRGKIVESPPMLFDHCFWSSFHERVVLQLCLHRFEFGFDLGNFVVQTLACTFLVCSSDRRKNESILLRGPVTTKSPQSNAA